MFHIVKALTSSVSSFRGMMPGEKTVLVTRKHWFFLFFPSWAFLISLFLPFLLYFYISRFTWFSFVSSLFWFLVSVYVLVMWIAFSYNLMVYLLTCTIITNKRLIKTETKGFFRYERDETDLGRIQDIAVKIFGIFAAFLNFGNLEVQTAGTVVRFIFPQLPNPQKIRELIMSLQEKRRR